MTSDVDVETEIQETAEEAVATDEPFIPRIERTNISDMSEFGDVEYYMWERYYIENKSPNTIRTFSNAVSAFEKFIEQSDRFDCSINNSGKREARRFRRWLAEQDGIQSNTAATYLNKIDNMAQFYLSDGYYEANPFEDLADGIDASDSDRSASYQSNDRITVDDSKLREAIRSTHGSSKIVLLAILVKTGVRISEACNLDWEDINIDHPLADDLLPNPRFDISDKPDSIFIDSGKTETTNNAHTSGNKRKVDSEIPIDSELKRLLLWHALTRERRLDSENPVFMAGAYTTGRSDDRLGSKTAWHKVTTLAEEYDWHGSEDEKKNITPHWFRAKAGSHLRNQLKSVEDGYDDMDSPKDIVKGIRGDVGDDIIETYNLREQEFKDIVRSCMFKIGLEGM